MPKTKAKRRVKREPHGNRTPLLANGLSYRVAVRNEDGSHGQRDVPAADIWRALQEAVVLMRIHGIEHYDPKQMWLVLKVAYGVEAASEMVHGYPATAAAARRN